MLWGASVVTSVVAAPGCAAGDDGPASDDAPSRPSTRAEEARQRRYEAADRQYDSQIALDAQAYNGDEEAYPDDFRGSFYKCLPQNEWAEVDRDAFNQLRAALEDGAPAAFDAIALDGAATRRLANPQAALAFNLSGCDPHGTRMRPAPAFASAETAAEMVEVYWHALLRDLPFGAYGDTPEVADALDDLNALSETVGPMVNGSVTLDTLFRGPTPGDLAGPYVSQFLLADIPFGQAQIEQRYLTPEAEDFGTEEADWLAIQRGAVPGSGLRRESEARYLYNARSLGAYVHNDQLFQAYLFAAAIALGYGDEARADVGYRNNPSQGGFTTLGGADILDTVTRVANLSLRAAWYQKWSVHRRLRPETFAGRVHFTAAGSRDYDVHRDVLDADAVARLFSAQGTALLPLAYPEGSPTHPAYPAGHATVAGACCTVLKAFFEEGFVVPNPVEASVDGLELLPVNQALTLGGELDKLASNIALGRDLAGVHYRSDGIDGLLVGEQVALAYLRDKTRSYNEAFGGFTFTSFDGRTVWIADGDVVWDG
ncbi:MAG: vanadium-dependent haloperoxidase [Myxococcota bacterium]